MAYLVDTDETLIPSPLSSHGEVERRRLKRNCDGLEKTLIVQLDTEHVRWAARREAMRYVHYPSRNPHRLAAYVYIVSRYQF
jgi:hypothetical protein